MECKTLSGSRLSGGEGGYSDGGGRKSLMPLGAPGGRAGAVAGARDRAAVLWTLGNDLQRGVKAEARCFSSN